MPEPRKNWDQSVSLSHSIIHLFAAFALDIHVFIRTKSIAEGQQVGSFSPDSTSKYPSSLSRLARVPRISAITITLTASFREILAENVLPEPTESQRSQPAPQLRKSCSWGITSCPSTTAPSSACGSTLSGPS